MDEDREKGRIAGLAVRRQKMTEHARGMVDVLRQARLSITGGVKQPVSLCAYADWLNSFDIKTERGKVWRAETVSRLFDIDQSIKEQADTERKRALEILRYKERLLTKEDSRAQWGAFKEALAAVDAEHAKIVAEAVALKAALIGDDSGRAP